MKLHVMKNGEEIRIDCMEDSHLINFLNLKINHLSKIKENLENQHKFENIINNTCIDVEKCKDYILNFNENISEYVLEANIRNLDISFFIKKLRELLNRDYKLDLTNNENYLLSNNYDEDDDEF